MVCTATAIVLFGTSEKGDEHSIDYDIIFYAGYRMKAGRHVCAGRAKHVDVHFVVTRTAPPDSGAGRAADPPWGPDVRDNNPKGNAILVRQCSCREESRHLAEKRGKFRKLRTYPS